ncbi:MAG TPA: right-handed parallel beta-helix repeat-containing protein [Bacteroidota bacterium]|nr:right-handed parallel beta-helix repeat-containing protein [Bacteroidota bacterium]
MTLPLVSRLVRRIISAGALIVAAILLIGSPAVAQLHGTYTIGSGGTYANFGAAVSALTSSGVSGAVTFNVLAGTYNEHIVLPSITGTSASNTITFQSATGNAADVTLEYSAGSSDSNYVVKMTGANYVKFHKMILQSNTNAGAGYCTIFNLAGSWDHLTIDSTALVAASSTSNTNQAVIITTTASTATSLVISGNTFTNGGYGIYLSGINSSNFLAGVQIVNNAFTASTYPIYGQYLDGVQVNGNTIYNNNNTSSIEIDYSTKAIQIEKNKITMVASATGVYMYGTSGGAGTLGNPPRALIANNFMSHTSNGNGIYLNNSGNIDIFYNSINMAGSSSSNCLYITSGSSINIENNAFANPAGGYAYNIQSPGSIGTIDYNDLYTPGAYIAGWNNTPYTTLAALQGVTGQEAHSLPYNPLYVSVTDLHATSPWLNGQATPLATVTDDIDGQARNGSTPDIGADEFTPAAGTTTPLSGTYTIGSGGTYATFKAAVTDLLLKGVSAPVTFNVLTGTYSEHIVLTNIPGSNSSNVVTFQASTGVAANVTLYYLTASSSDSNYVIKLNGAQNVRFHKMVLQANNNAGAGYSTVFALYGGWDNITIDSAVIGGSANTGSTNNALIVTTTGSLGTSCRIYGNTFSNGGYAAWMSGINGSSTLSGIQFYQNTVSGVNVGFYGQYLDSPMIDKNTFSGASGSTIEVDYSRNAIEIVKNTITFNNGNAIYSYNSSGGAGTLGNPPRALIADNFISSAANGPAIYLYGSSNFDLFFNSINMYGTSSSATDFYLNGGSVNNIEDNVFANPAGGYTYNIPTPGSVGTLDYNDLYTPGNFIAAWNNSSYISLAALQGVTGQETNSVPYNPMFTSSTNLHATSPWINNKGTPQASVSDDIDGQPRDGSNPDIGADEFTPAGGTTTPLAGTYTIGSSGTYKSFKAAVSDLLLKGISAPVTFNVLTGTYNEHIVLTPIPGSNSSNMVTFEANTGNAANVTLYYLVAASSDSNYVVKLNGAQNLRFHKMILQANNNPGAAYCTVFNLNGGWDNLMIDSAVVGGSANSSGGNNALIITNTGSVATSLQVFGNTFTNGGYALNLSGINSGAMMTGVQVYQNTFTGFNSTFYGNFMDSPLFDQNTLSGSSGTAVEMDNARNAIEIAKNKITFPAGTGIYLVYTTGGAGTLGNPARALIANNFLSTTGTGTGIYTYSTSNLDIFFNSVNMTGSSTSDEALYINAGSSINVEDNVFANPGGGYTYYIYSAGAISTIDYNDLYTPGTYIGGWANTGYTTLSALQAATAQESHSVPYNPVFVSSTDLHATSPWINGKATPQATVFDDIDGDARNGTNPDMGADEFTPAAGTTPPLAGTYTIGSGGNYASFKAAVADLLLKGVSAPVTFNALPGIYSEHILLTRIPGANSTNVVKFQSSTNHAADVTLFYTTAASSDSNYVVKVNGGGNLWFHGLTFQANNNSGAGYCTAINLNGGWDSLTVDSSIISGATNTSGSNQALIITENASLATSCTISSNTLSSGGYGIYFSGINNSSLMNGVTIARNSIIGSYTGMFFNYMNAPVIDQNIVNVTSAQGIEIDNSVNGIRVTRNRITTAGGGYGVYFYSVNGGAGSLGNPPKALIADNFVVLTGTNTGIDMTYSSNVDIYYNSVNMLGVSSNSAAFYAYAGGHLNILNNAFANPGGGSAYYIVNPGAVDTSDYNDYYTSGSTLAYWSGGYATLAALRTANSKDVSSISTDPQYFSNTNLYTANPALDSAATPRPEVTTDIDGKPRDPNKPDIGAVEFSQIATYTQNIQNAWNLLSLPLTVSDARATTLYPTAGSKAFGYSGSYVVRDTLVNRYGYWIRYNSATTAPIVGKPRLRDTITLQSGWNLIGSIGYPVAKASIVQTPVGIIDSKIFGYDASAGYIISDTVKPNFGYWIHTTTAGSMILDVHNTVITPGSADKAVRGLDLTALNSLQIDRNVPGAKPAMLYFTSETDLRDAVNSYALPPVPPAEAYDVRFGTNSSVELFDGTAGREVPIAIQAATGSGKLSWKLQEDGLVSYALVERTNGAVTSERRLTSSGSITISPASGKTYSLKANPLPAVYSLRQNYPNPFNPTTRIEFTLPRQAQVSLKIFNLLGQEIATLIDQRTMETGLHSVDVDAHSWSTGVYFYRITAGSFTDMKKMMLVK